MRQRTANSHEVRGQHGPPAPSLRLELLWQMLHNLATDWSTPHTIATSAYQVWLPPTRTAMCTLAPGRTFESAPGDTGIFEHLLVVAHVHYRRAWVSHASIDWLKTVGCAHLSGFRQLLHTLATTYIRTRAERFKDSQVECPILHCTSLLSFRPPLLNLLHSTHFRLKTICAHASS